MSFFWTVFVVLVVAFIGLVSAGSTAVGAFVALGLFVAGMALYFLPTIVAVNRAHLNRNGIFVLNLLLGWSLVGWVVALVWAMSRKPEVIAEISRAADSDATLKRSYAPVAQVPTVKLKKCPFCAEEVRAEAIKCKHCGSDLSGTVQAAAG